MGLMDFFKRGKERELEPKPDPFRNKEPEPKPMHREKEIYTVQKGDSLSKIAKEKYGDAQRWRVIYEANDTEIKDPNLIYPGQKLVIPREDDNDSLSSFSPNFDFK